LSTAIARSRNAGTYRPDVWMVAIRSSAAGDMSATQIPASDAKPFCRLK